MTSTSKRTPHSQRSETERRCYICLKHTRAGETIPICLDCDEDYELGGAQREADRLDDLAAEIGGGLPPQRETPPLHRVFPHGPTPAQWAEILGVP